MYKICPAGHGEFQQRVTSCPDCGGALELATSAEPPVRVVAELPPAHALTCIERGAPRALLEIAEQLQQVGISCRIDVHPPEQQTRPAGRAAGGANLGLYVLPSEAERATQVRTQHIQRSMPELVGHEVAAGTELSACPACGEALREAASECAACGLGFPDAEG
jgi:hypothetical protein